MRMLDGLGFMVLAGVCSCTSSSSGSGDSQTVSHQAVAAGETCGMRGTSTSAPVQYDCPANVSCGNVAEGLIHGGLINRDNYGICFQQCGPVSATTPRCPDGYGCPTGFNAGGTACMKLCKTDVDCNGPYQVCSLAYCDVVSCTTDSDCTGADPGTTAKCKDAVCVRS